MGGTATDGFSEVPGERIGAAPDPWASGQSYEGYVGRWSRPVAASSWPGSPSRRVPGGSTSGSGTGALTETVLVSCAPQEVVGVEPSAPSGSTRERQVADPRASFRAGDAQAIPVDDAAFDVAVSGLVLNFVPDRPAALAEMRRAVRPGGTVAAYVWDYPGEMQLMTHFWAAAVALDPAALSLDEAARFDFCRPDPLRALFTDAGLRDVDGRGHRRPHGLRRLRRLLDAVPRRHRHRPGVRDVLGRRRPARPPGRRPHPAAHRGRRLDPPHRPRLGGPRYG